MITKSLRLSDSMVSAIREIGRAEQIKESAAIRKLLRMGYGLYLAEQYRAGRYTLREVADRLELSLSETLDTLQRLGITGADLSLARSTRWNCRPGCAGLTCRSNAVFAARCSSPVSFARLSVNVSAMRNPTSTPLSFGERLRQIARPIAPCRPDSHRAVPEQYLGTIQLPEIDPLTMDQDRSADGIRRSEASCKIGTLLERRGHV